MTKDDYITLKHNRDSWEILYQYLLKKGMKFPKSVVTDYIMNYCVENNLTPSYLFEITEQFFELYFELIWIHDKPGGTLILVGSKEDFLIG